jgi:hypothetical protein
MPDNHLSISVRLRRVRREAVQLSVPITEELMCPNEDGDGRKLDVDKIIDAALRLGKLDSTNWEIDGEPEIQLHPVQSASGRTSIQ